MKSIVRIALLFASIVMVAVTNSWAQRVIKGTVYMDGKPAAGITVEAHKGGSMMTSFDGKYQVDADAKSKWLKFTYIDDVQKLDISGNASNKIDYAFSGELPTAGGSDEESGDVILKTAEELIKSGDKEFINEYSLYFEFYKQKDYESALPHWRKVYDKYPKALLNVYIQGIKMFESMADNAKTEEEKDKALDQIMKIYDKRIKYFGKEGFIDGRKGTTLLKYKLGPDADMEGEQLKETLKKAYDLLSKSVDIQENKTETPVLVLLMQTSKSLFKLGELPKETVVKDYDKCNSVANAIIAENADKDRVAKAKEIQPIIENIFSTSGAADCEALVNMYKPQFQEKSEDIDFIKSMLRRLGKANCEESELFSQATEKLYSLEPSAEAAFNMARRYLKKDDTAKAKEYYKQAMEQETDKALLATYYYEYGLFVFIKENAFAEARNYARKTLEIDPDYCEAYMLIGDIYVAASRTFKGDNFEKSTVYWLAVDYYNKARRNNDCAIDAAQKASNIKKYFPDKEEAFFRSMQEGQTYKVGGWINETTKVRF